MCTYSSDKYKFSVDWITIRVDADIDAFLADFCECYNLNASAIAVRKNGLYLYPFGYYLAELGPNVISFSYNRTDDYKNIVTKDDIEGNLSNYGVLCNITGDGCRWLQSNSAFGIQDFIQLCTRYNYNVTRFDVCCDILDPDNDVVPLAQKYGLEYYDMTIDKKIGMANGFSSKDSVRVDYVWDELAREYTPNITIGKRSSDKGQMQIYNKRVELEKGRLSSLKEAFFAAFDVQDYWYRIEYRCKSFANYVFENFVKSEYDAAVAFSCAAVRFGRFTMPNFVDGQHPTVTEWAVFLAWIESEYFV